MNKNKILPWVVLLLAALALLYFLNRGCASQRNGDSNGTTAAVNGNGGQTMTTLGFLPEQKFAYELAKALQAGEVDPNAMFVLDQVNFLDKGVTLDPLSYPQLDRFAAILHHFPDAQVRIEGHTDNQGVLRENLERSRLQALAVRDYLQSKGINTQRIAVVGRGSYKPLEPNTTAEGRKKNNRIEVYVMKS